MSTEPRARMNALGGELLFDRGASNCYQVPIDVSTRLVESVVHAAAAEHRLTAEEARAELLPVEGLTEWFRPNAAAVLAALAGPLGLWVVRGKLDRPTLVTRGGRLQISQFARENEDALAELFGGRHRFSLLLALLHLPNEEWYGVRQLAKLSGVDSGNATRWLTRWVATGVLKRDPQTSRYALADTALSTLLKTLLVTP